MGDVVQIVEGLEDPDVAPTDTAIHPEGVVAYGKGGDKSFGGEFPVDSREHN